jgi:NitT/TauT family transport system ATP-binding protein
MLKVRDLEKVYRRQGEDIRAIGGISLEVPTGRFASIVGPSGCGKTTLLRCICGLLEPTAGSVTVGDGDGGSGDHRVAVVFQDYARSLYPWMTVERNVRFPISGRGRSSREADERCREALEAVGLSGARDAYPGQLSGGMQQRVAIARALAFGPEVLLMDEPFAAVDAQTRAELEDVLLEVWERFGITVVFITHDIDESVYLSDRVFVLSASPSRVVDEVVVDLPRPRDQILTKKDPLFGELRERVYRQLRSGHGSRAAAAAHAAAEAADAIPLGLTAQSAADPAHELRRP